MPIAEQWAFSTQTSSSKRVADSNPSFTGQHYCRQWQYIISS